MRKIFLLQAQGKHPDRVMDRVKHEIRKYVKRERARALPAGADFWDFDCRFGLSKEAAVAVHFATIDAQIATAATSGATQFYLEVLAKPAARGPR